MSCSGMAREQKPDDQQKRGGKRRPHTLLTFFTGENFLHNAWVYRREPDRQPVQWERCGEELAC